MHVYIVMGECHYINNIYVETYFEKMQVYALGGNNLNYVCILKIGN